MDGGGDGDSKHGGLRILGGGLRIAAAAAAWTIKRENKLFKDPTN